MKKIVLSSLLAFVSVPSLAQTGEIMTGDTKLACEAVLCLSSSTRPTECRPSLQRYFGISYSSISDTIKGRLNFLNLCPVSSETPEMQALVSAISRGAGRCDAKFLNTSNKKTITYREYERVYEDGRYRWEWVTKEKEVISSNKPSYCDIYENHEFTELVTAKYVGTQENDGFWVDVNDYEAALIKYQEEQEQKKFNRRFSH